MTLIDGDRYARRGALQAAEPRDAPAMSSQPGLVERRDGLAVIETAWQRAASGRGGSVVVTGPPGIGKSRLLAEVVHGHEAVGDLVLKAQCAPDPDTPDHWPWRQILGQLRRLYSSGQPVLTTDPGEDLFPFYDATVSLVRSVAQQRPLALVIDDAHWADAGSLRLVDLACRSNADAALVVIVAYRDLEASLDQERATLLARIARHGHRVVLEGLSEAGTRALMASRSGDEMRESLVRRVHALTGGNPLLVEQARRQLTTASGLAELDNLPASTIGTVARFLETVGAGERLALHTAAVMGTSFSETVLEAVLSDHVVDTHEVLAALHRRGLIEPAGIQGSWAFADPLLREGLLSQLDASEAARIHWGVGEALREPSHRPPAGEAQIATHFVQAARHGGPVGPAVELCRAAALEASNRHDHNEAARWLDEAVDLACNDPATTDRERVDALLTLAVAQVRAGLLEPGRGSFERARRLAEQCDDVVAVARAVVDTVNAHRREAGWGPAIDRLAPSLERTTADLGPDAYDQPALPASLISMQAVASALSFDSATAQRWAEHATALAAGSADPEAAHAGLVAARWAALGSTSLDRQRELTDQLLLHAVQAGDPEEEWLALRWRLRDALEAGDPDLLNTSVARCLALAENVAQPSLLAQSYLLAATVGLIEGRFEDVHQLHSRSRTEFPEAVPAELILSQELYLSGEQGQVDLALAHALGEAFPAPSRAALDCWAETIRGDTEAARLAVERFFSSVVLEEIPDGAFLPIILCMMAEAVSHVGWGSSDRMGSEISPGVAGPREDAGQGLAADAERIRQQLSPLADRCTLGGDATPRVWFGSNHLYLGMLATALGSQDQAEHHLDAAQQVHRRMGARCHLVRGDLWRSRLAARRGDGGAARKLLESVVRRADLLGMTGVAAQARGDLTSLQEPAAVGRAPARWELCRDGDGWRLGTGTRSMQLRDRRGLGYLHTLLGRPGQEVHVLELAGGAGAILPSSGVGPALDGKAKAAYRQRVDDLRDQIAEGEQWGDPERVARAREELEAIARELARSMGLGGRDRPSDAGERARVSVRKAIRAAIGAIEEVAPEVATHLDATVRTGYYCVHVPDPCTPVTWHT